MSAEKEKALGTAATVQARSDKTTDAESVSGPLQYVQLVAVHGEIRRKLRAWLTDATPRPVQLPAPPGETIFVGVGQFFPEIRANGVHALCLQEISPNRKRASISYLLDFVQREATQ